MKVRREKTRRKILAVVLSVCMLLTVQPNLWDGVMVQAATSGDCGTDVSYTLDDEGVLTITGTGAMDDYKSQSPPWYGSRSSISSVIIENGVTSIGENAFNGYRNLRDVTIPGSVTSIGNRAFNGCIGLRDVTIPSSVTNIGECAFGGCSGLAEIVVENGNSKYDSRDNCNAIIDKDKNELVVGCKGTNIPESVTSIGEYAFYGCSNMTGVTIPSRVTSIGKYAFYGCSSLADVTIPSSVTNIGERAFFLCSSLTGVTIPDLVTSIGNGAFSSCAGLTSVTIPSSVTSIGTGVFSGCTGLTSVTIPSGVTSIGASMFSGCSKLTSVTIPSSVTSIGNSAFGRCTGLTSVTIPSKVTSIGNNAFSECTGLTSVTIPSSVTSIGSSAFIRCSSLTSVTIPSKVTSIGTGVFSGCTGLTSVTIPISVTSIGNSAFNRCTGLTSVTIPSSVTSIGDSAFNGCSKLTSVMLLGQNPPTIGSNIFRDCEFITKKERGIRVPRGTENTYKENWSEWKDYIKDRGAVKLNGDGGSGTDLTEYTYGTTTTLPTGWTKTGYDFAGWYEDESREGTAVTEISATTTGDKEYYAKWTPKSYTVTLNGNEGSGGIDLTSYTFGTGAVLPTNWTKTGYVFDGWYGNADCSGAEVKEISATATGDKEYWAKWTDNIAPVIGTLSYNYQPKNLWQWLIGKDSLVITVPVTEEGSGADKITYTETPDGGTASTKTANITDGKAEITVSADFKGTISIVCTDKAGNTSAGVTVGAGVASNGIIIEDNAPEIAFQAANAEQLPSGEYKTVPNIVVTVADDKNSAISGGIASVSYQVNGGSAKTVPHDYTTSMVLHDSFTIPASEISAGETEITVTATDNAGNSVTQKDTVKVHSHTGTLVPAIEPTCTTVGNKAYYTCTCGKEFSDSSCTIEITDHTEIIKNALGHDFSGKYQFDIEEHWKKCSRCPATDSREEHSFEEGGIHCTKCEFEEAGEGHTHSVVEMVPEKAASCTENGNKAYYTCNCGKWFSDSGCTAEITDKSVIEIVALGHDFSGEYQSDENGHWKVCSRCGEVEPKEVHVYDSATDTDCNSCGYRRTIENPGNVSKDVEKDEKAPGTVLSDSAEELADIILTEEEKGQIGNGTDIKFILDVKDAGDTVSSSDKMAVQQELGQNTEVKDFSIGQYLDISLFKVIGENRSAISQTARKLTIVIDVPDSLKSKDSTKPRTYAVICVHDGVAETLADLDDGVDTVTIAADRFSTYVLVYKEASSGTDVTPSPTPGGSTPSPTPGGSTPSPTPGEVTPSPTPGGSTPSPTPGETTSSPTPGGSTPSPTPGGTTPSPAPGGSTLSPAPGGSTPSPAPGGTTPNLTQEQQEKVNQIAKELNVPVETAIKLLEMAQELGIETDTLLLTEQDIVNQTSEGDVRGSFFAKLQAKAAKAKKNSITVKWTKVKGADGYQIYAAKCGKNNKYKLVKTIKKAGTTSFTYKKLKKGTGYRFIVRAYKNVDGKKYTVAASRTVHEVTEGGKRTNPKSVKVNKSTVKIRKGKKFRIKSKIVKANSGKKLSNHRKLSYESANREIATVSKKGVIQGRKAGKCIIYVYAENGIFKKIKVTVKK